MKETLPSPTHEAPAPDQETAGTETNETKTPEALALERMNELMDRLGRLLDEHEAAKVNTGETTESETPAAEVTPETDSETTTKAETTPEADEDTTEAGETETTAEDESPAVRRLTEARKRLADLIGERDNDSDTAETEESPETEDETEPTAEEEKTQEKKKATKGFLRKIGGWAVESLEANGFIPLRGKWHKRNGVTGFIAKTYVYSKQRKAARLAGFLSPEANAQLVGNEDGESSPESTGDDHEEEDRAQRTRRSLGRRAVNFARRTVRAPRTAYRTFKAIKNVK